MGAYLFNALYAGGVDFQRAGALAQGSGHVIALPRSSCSSCATQPALVRLQRNVTSKKPVKFIFRATSYFCPALR